MDFVIFKRICVGLFIVGFLVLGMWGLLAAIGNRHDYVLRIAPICIGLSALLNGVVGFTHKQMVARSGTTLRLEEENGSSRWTLPAFSILAGLVFILAGTFAP
jgi:hypothetical protein